MVEEKDTLRSNLLKTTEFIITLEEKLFKSNKINLDLIGALKNAESSMVNFPSYLLDQNRMGKGTYRKVKNDEIDLMVADYINLHPERKFLIPLISREAKGIYVFGSKTVHISL